MELIFHRLIKFLIILTDLDWLKIFGGLRMSFTEGSSRIAAEIPPYNESCPHYKQETQFGVLLRGALITTPHVYYCCSEGFCSDWYVEIFDHFIYHIKHRYTL